MTLEVRGGIGLAAQRVARGPATLITHTPYHAALRTPSRPTFGPGNCLHLHQPPDELDRWFDAFERVVGVLPGVGPARLSWEVTGEPDLAVAGDLDRELHTVLRLDGESSSTALPPDIQLVRVDEDEHRLAGARTLYLQGGWGTDVDAFRWLAEQELAITRAGRGHLVVGYRYGIPVVRLGLFHDLAGLAVVDGVVVHPLYRGEGLATAVVGQAIDALRAQLDEVVVVAVAPTGSTAVAVAERLGLRPVGTTVTVTMPR